MNNICIKKYDLVVLSTNKDYNKIKFLYKSLTNLNPMPENIYVISPTKIKECIDGINYYLDVDVLNIEREKIKYRPNWISQQFIKLFQNITINNNYLVIDSDVYINRKINLFDGNRNNFFISSDQHHLPYFNFLRKYGIQKNFKRSFISEIMLFNKSIINDFLSEKNMDRESFIENSIKLIDNDCYISEFEFYGNMVLQNYPELYGFKNIINQPYGKNREWDDSEIDNHINNNNNADIISYHSWI